MKFRRLRADEIDCRIGAVSKEGKGLSLLLYKDARVDMNILDESGVKWKREHRIIDGNLYCTISIWDSEINQWISREDVGIESYAEKEKGQASDAFKRAGFNFGIGRELYTAPFIWINSKDCRIDNGKCRDVFSVTSIGYDEKGNINQLEIKNRNSNRVVFSMGKNQNFISNESVENERANTTFNSKEIARLYHEVKNRLKSKEEEDKLCAYFKKKVLFDLTHEELEEALTFWRKTA